jgi:hypothetical protein
VRNKVCKLHISTTARVGQKSYIRIGLREVDESMQTICQHAGRGPVSLGNSQKRGAGGHSMSKARHVWTGNRAPGWRGYPVTILTISRET